MAVIVPETGTSVISSVTAPPETELLATLEEALFEIRRVIAGQEEMLERVLVCLLSGGHLLIDSGRHYRRVGVHHRTREGIG